MRGYLEFIGWESSGGGASGFPLLLSTFLVLYRLVAGVYGLGDSGAPLISMSLRGLRGGWRLEGVSPLVLLGGS